MSDTSGHMSGMHSQPYARWSRSSRTWTDTGLLGLPMSLGTLPTWGCLRDGELYEHPTPARPTAESGSSSLLPSPISRDHKEQTLGWTWERDGMLQEDTLPRAITGLLPTPLADHSCGLPQPGTDYQSLPNAVMDLLPTPVVNDMGAGKDPEWWKEWAARQKSADGRPAPHGRSLEQELIGVSTSPLLDGGNGSSTDPPPAQPSPGTTTDPDSVLFSWSG